MGDEGIGGRKWSVVAQEDAVPVRWQVMDGLAVIATVFDKRMAVLICGAPQLWAAANEVLVTELAPVASSENDRRGVVAMERLGGQVARCVGKLAWTDVSQ